MTTATVRQQTEARPPDFHWSADEFERACEAGAFGHDVRLELIHGRVVAQMSQSSLHANLVEYLTNCLQAVLVPRFRVRDEKPLRLALDGELVPDVMALRGRLTDLRQPHPTPGDVVLLVEVAVSSEDYDLGEKALLYSQAGVEDYWVVLPEQEEIIVHRAPAPDGYRSVVRLGHGDTVFPLAAADAVLAVRDLLTIGAVEE